MDVKNYGIVLEAETTDCTIEIYLNDIPVGLCGIGGSRALSRPIHEYLLDGENEIGVIVNPGDTPAKAMQFSRLSMPAHDAQPPPDAAMDAYIEARRKEEREQRQAQAKAKQNGDLQSKETDESDITDENLTVKDQPKLEDDENESQKENSENGENEPPNDDSDEDFEDEESTLSFNVKLTMYEVGVIAGTDDGEVLLELDWNARESAEILRAKNYEFPLAEENAVGAQIFPIYLTKKEDLGEMFGAFEWLNAKPLTLDEETVDEVSQFIFFIRDLIEEGDADSILDISGGKYREVAAAYNISAEERTNLFQQLLAQESEKPYWIFETPEDEEFSLRLCAHGKLIECVAHDWKPLIRGVPSPEGRFMFPMLIGKIDEDWIIMR